MAVHQNTKKMWHRQQCGISYKIGWVVILPQSAPVSRETPCAARDSRLMPNGPPSRCVPVGVMYFISFILSNLPSMIARICCGLGGPQQSVDVEVLIGGVRALRRSFVEVGPLAASKRPPSCLAKFAWWSSKWIGIWCLVIVWYISCLVHWKSSMTFLLVFHKQHYLSHSLCLVPRREYTHKCMGVSCIIHGDAWVYDTLVLLLLLHKT